MWVLALPAARLAAAKDSWGWWAPRAAQQAAQPARWVLACFPVHHMQNAHRAHHTVTQQLLRRRPRGCRGGTHVGAARQRGSHNPSTQPSPTAPRPPAHLRQRLLDWTSEPATYARVTGLHARGRGRGRREFESVAVCNRFPAARRSAAQRRPRCTAPSPTTACAPAGSSRAAQHRPASSRGDAASARAVGARRRRRRRQLRLPACARCGAPSCNSIRAATRHKAQGAQRGGRGHIAPPKVAVGATRQERRRHRRPAPAAGSGGRRRRRAWLHRHAGAATTTTGVFSRAPGRSLALRRMAAIQALNCRSASLEAAEPACGAGSPRMTAQGWQAARHTRRSSQ